MPTQHPKQLEIMDVVWNAIKHDHSTAKTELAKLPAVYSHVYITAWVEAEVNNGGFDQFFSNPHGIFVDEAVAGFRALGSEEYAKIVLKAHEIHKSNPNRTDRDPAFDPFDEEFYDLDETNPAVTLRSQYIERHLKDFTLNK